MNKYNEERQERLTLSDVKMKQADFRKYLEMKIQNPVVIEKDKEALPLLMADALLSQPALSRLKPSIELRDTRITLGSDCYDFLLKLLIMPIYKKPDGKYYSKLHLRKQVFEVGASELWRLLYYYASQLSAGAVAEGIARSKEKEIRKPLGVASFSDRGVEEE